MENNKIISKTHGLGIASFILGICAIISSIFIFPSVLFGILSIILGIISLVKKSKKVMPVVGIVLSAISGVISILVICLMFIFAGFVDKVNNDDKLRESIGDKIQEKIEKFQDEVDNNDELRKGLTQFYNDISEGITDELDIDNKIDGYSFKASDGSLIEFNIDGTYTWYKDANNKSDNYYVGKYKTYLGDRAVEKIDEKFGFNNEAYKHNTEILRTDIYFLVLDKEYTVIDGKKEDTVQTVHYALFFYNGDTEKCDGMNLNTQNIVHFTKVN